MRVILELQSGACSGRKAWMKAGQIIQVGRTERADFVVPDDAQISSLHFALECERHSCLLRDLNSANGTNLNGERVTRASLHDGDVIVAGQTRFSVRVEGGAGRKPSGAVPQPGSHDLQEQDPQPVQTPLDDIGDLDNIPGEGTARVARVESAPSNTISSTPKIIGTTSSEILEATRQPLPEKEEFEAPSDTSESERAASFPPLQQVVLEIDAGPSEGRKLQLRPGQSLSVGRTEHSEFVLPTNLQLSGRHFLLHCDRHCCKIRDLQSSNGTFLNDQRISEAIICDGDEILAGTSKFAIHITGGIPATEREITGVIAPMPDLSVDDAALGPLPPLSKRSSYTQFPCGSGLSLFRGSQTDFDPADIADRLSQIAPMYVVVDATKLGTITWDGEQSTVLFEGLSETEAESSPLLLGPSQQSDVSSLIAGGWSQEAVICIYSRHEERVLIERLREFSRAQLESPATQELARFGPDAMAEFLANDEPEAVASLMLSFDAVFMEVHGGERWAVFAGSEFGTILDKIGVTRTPEWDM